MHFINLSGYLAASVQIKPVVSNPYQQYISMQAMHYSLNKSLYQQVKKHHLKTD